METTTKIDFTKHYEKLGKRIKGLRQERRMTLDILERKTGVNFDYLEKVEDSIIRPGLITVFKIAHALEIEVKELFEFDET